MTATIRRAGEADIPALFAIRTAVRENHMTLAALEAAGVTPDTVAATLRGGVGAAWIALQGERPLAFSMARADPGDLFALFVMPGSEGLGLGSRLLQRAETWLASRGIAEAWLLTGGEPELRAPGFYARRGWRVAGREPDGQIRFTKLLDRRS